MYVSTQKQFLFFYSGGSPICFHIFIAIFTALALTWRGPRASEVTGLAEPENWCLQRGEKAYHTSLFSARMCLKM